MKKVLWVLILVASLTPRAAIAEVIGVWTESNAGSGLDRWTLTVTPGPGVVMAGFNLDLYDTAGTGPFQNNGLPFGTSKGTSTPDGNTQFLLQLSHGTKPNVVTDVNAQGASVDSDDLTAVIAAVSGGIYDQGGGVVGWTSSLPLLALVVPSASDPFSVAANGTLTGLAFLTADDSKAGICYHPDGSYETIQFQAAPEPSTLAMLACGLCGLLAYAGLKRK